MSNLSLTVPVYVDLDPSWPVLVKSSDTRLPAGSLVVVSGDKRLYSIRLHQTPDGSTWQRVGLPSGWTMVLSGKRAPGGETAYFTNSTWTSVGSGTTLAYTATLDFGVDDAIWGDPAVPTLDFSMDLEIRDATNAVRGTWQFPLVLHRENYGSGDTPADPDYPFLDRPAADNIYLSLDAAQTWSGEQQEQGQDNLGAGTTGKAVFGAETEEDARAAMGAEQDEDNTPSTNVRRTSAGWAKATAGVFGQDGDNAFTVKGLDDSAVQKSITGSASQTTFSTGQLDQTGLVDGMNVYGSAFVDGTTIVSTAGGVTTLSTGKLTSGTDQVFFSSGTDPRPKLILTREGAEIFTIDYQGNISTGSTGNFGALVVGGTISWGTQNFALSEVELGTGIWAANLNGSLNIAGNFTLGGDIQAVGAEIRGGSFVVGETDLFKADGSGAVTGLSFTNNSSTAALGSAGNFYAVHGKFNGTGGVAGHWLVKHGTAEAGTAGYTTGYAATGGTFTLRNGTSSTSILTLDYSAFTAARTISFPDAAGTVVLTPGSTSITTLGTITTGTWSATAIAVAKGGTGGTTAREAQRNLSLGRETVIALDANQWTTATISGTVASNGTVSGIRYIDVSGSTAGFGRAVYGPSSYSNLWSATAAQIDFSQSWRLSFRTRNTLGSNTSARHTILIGCSSTPTAHTLANAGFAVNFKGNGSTVDVFVSAHNGTSQTNSTVSAAPLTAGTTNYYDWELEWIPATGLYLYQNGTLVCSLTTGLPSGTGSAGNYALAMIAENVSGSATATNFYLMGGKVNRF